MKLLWGIFGAFLLTACGGGTPASKLNVGDLAPSFQTTRADGTAVNFPAAWAGKPVVIRFWADWCKYCEPEMKAIEPIYQQLKTQGLEVIAINAGQDRATVLAYMDKLRVSYPALLDERSAIARQFGVVGLPTTYFIDAKGVVRIKLIGEAESANFERAAREILK
jgi:cytochrome c biogenesis protein CcmG/thiol:disulfide interchange protein DsbE